MTKENEYYCTHCEKLVPANEVELWETYYEGEFEDAHIKCGGTAKLQMFSTPKKVKAVQRG